MRKLLILLLFITSAQAEVLKLSQGQVEFKAKAKPALISIDGKSNLLSGTLTGEDNIFDGNFDLELTSLDTGIELRDDHLKNKYLEIEKFPNAKLSFTKTRIEKNKEINFEAKLNLHGQEKMVQGIATLNDDNRLEAEFKINLSDFGIDIPSFKGITVAKEVKIKVNGKVE